MCKSTFVNLRNKSSYIEQHKLVGLQKQRINRKLRTHHIKYYHHYLQHPQEQLNPLESQESPR